MPDLKHTTEATVVESGNGEIGKAEWNESHQFNMAANRLLGRSTAGTGTVEEITVGTGLTLAGQTLTGPAGSGLTLLNVAVFTASGNWTPNANTKLAFVELIGGGGGGRSGFTATITVANHAGGGGGGGVTHMWFVPVAEAYTVVVGGGGGNGSAGGSTSLAGTNLLAQALGGFGSTGNFHPGLLAAATQTAQYFTSTNSVTSLVMEFIYGVSPGSGGAGTAMFLDGQKGIAPAKFDWVGSTWETPGGSYAAPENIKIIPQALTSYFITVKGVSQTFTPVADVTIATLYASIHRSTSPSPPTDALYAQIRSGGRDGTIIATSDTIQAVDIPTASSQIRFSFAPVSLLTGTVYSLEVLRTNTSLDNTSYVYLANTTNAYAEGDGRIIDFDGSTAIMGTGNTDLDFQLTQVTERNGAPGITRSRPGYGSGGGGGASGDEFNTIEPGNGGSGGAPGGGGGGGGTRSSGTSTVPGRGGRGEVRIYEFG